jgi:hypothetical protein
MHVAGATLAAAAFGLLLGAAGGLLGAPWGRAGLWMVSALAGLYLAREAVGLRVPVPQLRRQVPDWWRTFFPFGPASFLYGLGLGVGFLTYLSHGTLVVVAVAAVASGRPLLGAAVLAPFGLARGLSSVAAGRARTPDDGSALVDRLARAASWVGWRVAHSVALVAVLSAALLAIPAAGPAEAGGAAAAALAVTFAAAGAAKIARRREWRRALASYRLPPPVERVASLSVPVAELSLAAMPLLGLSSKAGIASLVALAPLSAAVVVGRIRGGRLLDCGCFGSRAERDYRLLLARNAALAVLAAVAWREALDAPVGRSLGLPSGAELLPAALVVVGLGIAVWVGGQAVVVVRRGAGR